MVIIVHFLPYGYRNLFHEIFLWFKSNRSFIKVSETTFSVYALGVLCVSFVFLHFVVLGIRFVGAPRDALYNFSESQ